MARHACIVLLLFSLLIPAVASAQDGRPPLHELRADNLSVVYPDGLEDEAQHIVDIYPSVRARLAEKLGLPANVAHTVVITSNNKAFVQTTGSNLIVAYAEGARRLVVLDYAAVAKRPAALTDTLTHELCHLVLHDYVTTGPDPQGAALLPRWLNEGICQWVSGGANEMAALGQSSELENAVLGERLIPLHRLEQTFPSNDRGLMLSYEESLSAVEYIVGHQGRKAMLDILENLRQGYDIDFAIHGALNMTHTKFEDAWHASLRLKYTWFTWLSNNLLAVLFAAGGLLLILGFARAIWRYWRYRDEDELPDGNAPVTPSLQDQPTEQSSPRGRGKR